MVTQAEEETNQELPSRKQGLVRQEYQAPTIKCFGRLSGVTQGSGSTVAADQFSGNKGKNDTQDPAPATFDRGDGGPRI